MIESVYLSTDLSISVCLYYLSFYLCSYCIYICISLQAIFKSRKNNTWENCHFLNYVANDSEICSVVSDSMWPHGLYSPWNSLGQNTGVGSRSLLQEIFPTQGSNPGLPHCRQILYQLSHKKSPRTLEWVAYPFSSWSSWPRNGTGVSCIAGGFFTSWTVRKANR